MIPFETENERAYVLLLRIEIFLRESLKAAMHAEFGARWQKQLPGDLRAKIKEAQTEEAKPQFDHVRLGPLYYLSFGELLKLVQRKPGRVVADSLGGENFLRQLESILIPRNAVCHSRPASTVGLKVIEVLYAQMETALTPAGLARVLASPDTGMRQLDAARAIVLSLQRVLDELPGLPLVLPTPDAYESAAAQFWWDDDSLAGFVCSRVDIAVGLLREYNALPGGVGSAGSRQRFCEQSDLRGRIEDAVVELRKARM